MVPWSSDGCIADQYSWGTSVSHCVSSELNIPFVRIHDEFEYKGALGDLIRSYFGRAVQEVSFSCVVICCLSHLLYLIGRLGYW